MRTIDELVAEAEVFAGLSSGHLQVISGCARDQHLEAGRLLLREGEPADTFFLIRQGAVALELHAPDRGSLRIQTLHDRDVVGWSWLFEPYRWQMDARALEPCSLIAFDGACLRGKAEQDHELGYQLMRSFAGNLLATLQATRFQLLDVYGHAASRV